MNKTDLTQTIIDGERLRMALLVAFRAAAPLEQPSVLLELLMFYGQAFKMVQEILISDVALAGEAAPRLWQAKVIHEGVCGQAIYEVWRQSSTPCLAQEEYERMTAHWHRILGLVGV